MTKASFTLDSYTIAELDIDPASVRGDGGADYPRLIVHGTIRFNPLKDSRFSQKRTVANAPEDLLFLSLTGQLFVEGQPSKIADSTSLPFFYVVSTVGYERQLTLEFALNAHRVEKIEQWRDGDCRLRCEISVGVGIFGLPRYGPDANKPQPPHITDIRAVSTTASIPVLQSAWVNQVLPGLGYGLIHLIEMPGVSLEACKALSHSYEALDRAYERFKLGDYDEAVALCRTAVEPLRNELTQIKAGAADSLAADWAEKIGTVTVDWLKTVLGKTYGVANTPVHSPCTGHFSRLDAQMILTVATSVIGYVARTKAAKS